MGDKTGTVPRRRPPAPRRTVRRMRPYRPPVEGRGEGLRLDFNENTVGAPPSARKALAGLTAERIAMYPEYADAKPRLARFFGVSPREIIPTSGTDEALHLVVDTFADPGDEVLVVEPTYAMYRFYAERAGAKVRSVRYGKDFAFPVTQVLRALERGPRILFIASPNNPTGTVAPPEEIAALLETAPATLVVVDEAYAEFSGRSVLGWIRRYPNLAVTRTFSKAQGLAALRLGCLMANAALMRSLARAHSPYSVSTAALLAGLAAAADQRPVLRYVEEVRRGKSLLYAALDRLGITAFTSGANFVLVDVGRRAPKLVADLKRRGILVRDRRSDFGRPGFVRITVGTTRQTRALIRVLQELWPA